MDRYAYAKSTRAYGRACRRAGVPAGVRECLQACGRASLHGVWKKCVDRTGMPVSLV